MTSVVCISVLMILGAAQYHWNPYELFTYGNGFIIGALLLGFAGFVFEIVVEINFKSSQSRTNDEMGHKRKRRRSNRNRAAAGK